MKFRYVIWDFDGTLFDTYPAMIQAFERGLADFGVSVPRARIAALMANTLAICLETLCREYSLEPEALDERVSYYHQQTTMDQEPPFPGAMQVCERLVAAGGQNFLFTHRSRDSMLRFMDHYHMAPLFADCLSVEDGYPRKPDPAGFIALIEKHHLLREQGLAVGDRTLDILAGQGAGVRTCLFNAVPDAEVQPDYVIQTFAELETILGVVDL